MQFDNEIGYCVVRVPYQLAEGMAHENTIWFSIRKLS